MASLLTLLQRGPDSADRFIYRETIGVRMTNITRRNSNMTLSVPQGYNANQCLIGCKAT